MNPSPPPATPNRVIEKRRGACLPHWRLEDATYAVTFRLADSLPAERLARWRWERDHIVLRAEQLGRPLTSHELDRLGQLHSERIETWLDAGHGSCVLRDPRIAQLVRDAMLHFDGDRYSLRAWCIMPNHVHAVVRPQTDHELSEILQSWKGFTGNKARKILGGAGPFWQKEPYDHLIRNDADYQHQVQYILDNPRKAGLHGWLWVWAASDPH